jgi:hypothetical protein
MKWLLSALLAAFLVYLLYDEFKGGPIAAVVRRKRLCDYYLGGSVFEDIPSAIQRGVRLLEVHVYADERDEPVVALTPQAGGKNFSENNVSFEQVCVDIVNDAFPSKDPFILSIVAHTEKGYTLNKVAEHLTTITRRHLLDEKDIQDVALDSLANMLILVSGGNVQGSALEPLLNLSWSESGTRRLSYQQALHPRDPKELKAFNRDFITIVGPQPELKTITANPATPFAMGCQWNLIAKEPLAFTEKSFLRV